jgi:hypothetical protein
VEPLGAGRSHVFVAPAPPFVWEGSAQSSRGNTRLATAHRHGTWLLRSHPRLDSSPPRRAMSHRPPGQRRRQRPAGPASFSTASGWTA